MMQKNKFIKTEHVGDYGNFLPNRYIFDVMNIDAKNTLYFKSYKYDSDSQKNNKVIEDLKLLGYCGLYYGGSETYLIHKTYNSLVVVGNYVNLYYCDKFKLVDKVIKVLSEHEKNTSANDNVYFLIANNYSMEKIPLTLPKFEFSEDSYNINFSVSDIINKLSLDKSGLMMFMGDPGTGKSFLIKQLIKSVKKEFVFVTQDMVQYLFEPKNIGFVLKNLKDNVLILEDSENLFVDRKKQPSSTVSTILNLCDGIMGDLFRIKIIATINIKEHIDDALFRKGRLLAEVDFQKLSVESSNRLLKRIGSDKTVNHESTLAELYNIGDSNGHLKEKNRIGFELGKKPTSSIF